MHGTASHIETLVRQYRRAREAEELSREERQQATRGLRYFYDDDGSLVVKARLPAEIGALFIRALDAAMKDQPVRSESPKSHDTGLERVSAETQSRLPSFAMRRADSLAAISETFLAHGAAALNGGERHQIVVHIDAEVLRDGVAGRCHIEDGPSLPVETVRRLACDSSVVAIAENADGQPLDVGRKTRSIPPALRRALRSRDGGCRFPGCSNKRYVDAHHIRHRARGGETKPSNLVTLCRFHHRQVHEGNVVIQTLDDGAIRFVRRDGRSFDSPNPHPQESREQPDWRQLVAAHRVQQLHIDHDTAVTLWRGDRMDHDLAIAALLQRAHHESGNVSAEIRATNGARRSE